MEDMYVDKISFYGKVVLENFIFQILPLQTAINHLNNRIIYYTVQYNNRSIQWLIKSNLSFKRRKQIQSLRKREKDTSN